MKPVRKTTLVAVFLRSFAIQGTWNYRTLIGWGFAFALLPVLRTIYLGRPEEYDAAVQRHTAVFNSHPYFSPMALGAVTVLEATESPAVVERFKTAVRGALGGLGDRLVWAGFRPLCILLAVVAALLGAGWPVVVTGFLLLYNTGHVALRIWAMRFGLRHGRALGEQLRNVPVERIQRLMQNAATFLVGLAVALLASGRPLQTDASHWWALAVLGGVALGARLGNRMRTPAVLALVGFVLLAVLAGVAA